MEEEDEELEAELRASMGNAAQDKAVGTNPARAMLVRVRRLLTCALVGGVVV